MNFNFVRAFLVSNIAIFWHCTMLTPRPKAATYCATLLLGQFLKVLISQWLQLF